MDSSISKAIEDGLSDILHNDLNGIFGRYLSDRLLQASTKKAYSMVSVQYNFRGCIRILFLLARFQVSNRCPLLDWQCNDLLCGSHLLQWGRQQPGNCIDSFSVQHIRYILRIRCPALVPLGYGPKQQICLHYSFIDSGHSAILVSLQRKISVGRIWRY